MWSHALNALKSELKAYAKKRNSFLHVLHEGMSMRSWWMKMQQDDDAHVLGVLAIKLYSVVPNSITDKRTMLTITWLNSARRSKQDVQTLQDYIKIRQWYHWDPQSTKKAPTVSWYVMDKCRNLGSSDRGNTNKGRWGRSTGSYRSDGEQGSNLRLGTKVETEVPRAAEAGLYTGEDKGRLCTLVRAQLVCAQHADAALGAVDNNVSISGI
ncbi:predicted protein [Postia placenta Mad-698-R]|nr:predicted protein [Postia placenta Mad-698-R]